MTTAAFPASQLAAEARNMQPGRVLLTAILAVFAGIGWLTGTEITGLAFCAVTVRYGYRTGRGFPPGGRAAVQAPETAARKPGSWAGPRGSKL